ncbi:MauE/DoxX family redox-associated membrane protein [Micromonospora sp. B11E3]|uniref:MauE/DoxX family redox-associated membrane protein n=1 Tax=Micromonospora sp. B11E3 TaxID=3153562 RepID=UPI00325DDB70
MSALVAGVATYTVLFTLLVAVAEHLSRPAALARALAAHRVLPAPVPVAAAVIAAEGLLAGVGLVAALGDGGAVLVAVLVGSFALFGLYAGYGRHVTSTGRTGSCGCSRIELPMTGWVVARAVVLAGLALLAVILSGSVVPLLDRADATHAVVLLAAATFTALLWHLPAAMYVPPGAAEPAVAGRRDRSMTERGGVAG